jgi:hypothetical protein
MSTLLPTCSTYLVIIAVPAALSVSEGVALEVCAELFGAPPNTVISVTLATIESSPGESGLGPKAIVYMCIFISASAVADTDFINTTSLSFDFGVGSMPGDTHCIYVLIFNDGALEEDETFNVALTLTTSDPNVMLGNDSTTITITDDDSEHACFQLVNHVCKERSLRASTRVMHDVLTQ